MEPSRRKPCSRRAGTRAPDRAVGAVARAVERDADDGRLLVVLGHAGEDVRVVVLDLEERHAGFLGERLATAEVL